MKHKNFLPIFLIVLWLSLSLWVWYLYYISTLSIKNTTIEDIGTGSQQAEEIEIELPKTEEEIRHDLVQAKIEKVRGKMALKWIVSEGDMYLESNELSLALKAYLEAFRKNTNDVGVKEKIGDTYFAMKRFKNALNYYKDLDLQDSQIQEKYIKSSFYTLDLSSEIEKEQFLKDLEENKVSEEISFYYRTTLACLWDFHGCKLAFEEYFNTKIEVTPGILEPRAINYPPLQGIKKSIEDYKNFQLDDVYYKDALLVSRYFQEGTYPIAIELWEKLVEEKTNYKPILKVIAESYFELGDYDSAKDALANYYKIDTSDPTILYMLGIIYSRERDYVLSNIYFGKALEWGFQPSINARRNLIYNYFLLDSEANLLSEFKNVIEKEESFLASDLHLAIYYHILYGDSDTAKKWIVLGKKQFPKDANFYAYAAYIYRGEKRYELAKQELDSGMLIGKENPFLLLNKWFLEQELWNEWNSIIYFKKVISLNGEGEFWTQAQEALDQIEKDKKWIKALFN